MWLGHEPECIVLSPVVLNYWRGGEGRGGEGRGGEGRGGEERRGEGRGDVTQTHW